MQTISEVESVVLLDFEYTPACEGTHHQRGLSGHDPEAPGAYMVISPCCGPKVIQCEPRVRTMIAGGLLTCTGCGLQRFPEDYRFVPLDSL